MIQFYAPNIIEDKTLPESDSQHCVRVLRMNVGDRVEVVDGQGSRFICEIIAAHPKRTVLEIISRKNEPLYWNHQIVAAVAPTKHMDRMEWMVEKLTEIGINRIIPMWCERSERKEIKTERLEKIAISAMKQSLQATLPKIEEMTKFSDIINRFSDYQKFVGYCEDGLPKHYMGSLYERNRDVAIMIGPEGDFTPKEIENAMNRGWEPVTFGPNRLRTETATLTAVEICHVKDMLSQGKSC